MVSFTDFKTLFGNIENKITSSFSSEWKTLRTDISKQVRYLKQDLVGKKASKEDKADILIKLFNGDTSALDSCIAKIYLYENKHNISLTAKKRCTKKLSR